MKRTLFRTATVSALCFGIALFTACGGSSSSSSGSSGTGTGDGSGPAALPYTGKKTQADVNPITALAVATSYAGSEGYVPVCTANGSTGKVTLDDSRENVATIKAINLIVEQSSPKILALRAIGSSAPADVAGTCGGFLRYKNWSHASGSTTGTLSYENYCYKVITTGDKTTINGEIPFSAPGTSGTVGPVTSKITASSPTKMTIKTTSSTNVTKLNAEIAFDNLELTPGTPVSGGGTTNATNPDNYKVGKVATKNITTGKQAMLENVAVTMVKTSNGGTKENISGRMYDTDIGYLDVTTTTPILIDSAGIHTAGVLTISGSNPANNATLTIAPATAHSPSFTLKVNSSGFNFPAGAVDCYNPLTRRN
jgi:hypothetical protein